MVDSRSKADEQLLKDSEAFLRKSQQRLERDKGISDELRKTLQARLNELRHVIKENDVKKMRKLLPELQEFWDKKVGSPQKSTWREYAESISLAIIFALVLRGFVIEAFKIPTGSMIPTLLVGDHLFVNKFIYGLRVPFTNKFMIRFSEPERGEVVVFTFPRAEATEYLNKQPAGRRQCIDSETLRVEKDFIKRIIGVAGDTIELRDNRLIVNGKMLPRTYQNRETTGNFLYPHTIKELEEHNGHKYNILYEGSDKNFGPITVKPGHVFAMGDNRDRSSDSRCWGQVPVENIKGRAMIIWWSIGPESLRFDRMGQLIH